MSNSLAALIAAKKKQETANVGDVSAPVQQRDVQRTEATATESKQEEKKPSLADMLAARGQQAVQTQASESVLPAVSVEAEQAEGEVADEQDAAGYSDGEVEEVAPGDTEAAADDGEETDAAPVIAGNAAAEEFSHPSQPEGLTAEQVDAFKNAVQILYDCYDNAEVVGQAIKSLLVDLKNHPQFREILSPEDCGMMVRALRESYGVAIVKKETTKKKKSDKAADAAMVDQFLANVNFNF